MNVQQNEPCLIRVLRRVAEHKETVDDASSKLGLDGQSIKASLRELADLLLVAHDSVTAQSLLESPQAEHILRRLTALDVSVKASQSEPKAVIVKSTMIPGDLVKPILDAELSRLGELCKKYGISLVREEMKR